jgi:hypothetical protein
MRHSSTLFNQSAAIFGTLVASWRESSEGDIILACITIAWDRLNQYHISTGQDLELIEYNQI